MSFNDKNPLRAQRLGPGLGKPWAEQEKLLLAVGFLQKDLEGTELHRWLRKQGSLRSPGAIDAQLVRLNYFDTYASLGIKNSKSPTKRRKHDLDLAKRALRKEIELARREMQAGIATPLQVDWDGDYLR